MNAYFCESIWLLNYSALRSISITETSSLLWLRLTSHSSLLLQIILSVRPHGISLQSFLVYLPNLPVWVTIAFWISRLFARSSIILALVLGFCSSGYDFAIPSSRPHLAIQTLGVAIRFVGNYALCGLSPQTNGMPVIQTKTAYRACSVLFLFAFYGKLCYSMYVVTPIWHQKGGDFDGIHNYHFSGGHGTSDWSLRVQVVRPPASRQLAQNKNPRNGAPRIFCDFNGHNYRFSG